MTAPMMAEAITAADARLREALGTVSRATVQKLGATVTTPSIVVGPPELQWESQEPLPTSARFLIYVIVAIGETAVEELLLLACEAAAAIDEQTRAVVLQAKPATYVPGDLPCYELTVEASI